MRKRTSPTARFWWPAKPSSDSARRPNREPVPVTVRRSATRNGRQWLPVCNGRMPRLKFPPTFCPPGAKPAGVLCPLMTNGAERRRPPVRNLTMLSTTVCRKLGQSSERVKNEAIREQTKAATRKASQMCLEKLFPMCRKLSAVRLTWPLPT